MLEYVHVDALHSVKPQCPSFDSYDLIQLDLSSLGIVILPDIISTLPPPPPPRKKEEEIMENYECNYRLKML